MESTTKPFDLRSVPIQAVAEPIKHKMEVNVGLPQSSTDVSVQRENTYNGKLNRNIFIYLFIFYF